MEANPTGPTETMDLASNGNAAVNSASTTTTTAVATDVDEEDVEIEDLVMKLRMLTLLVVPTIEMEPEIVSDLKTLVLFRGTQTIPGTSAFKTLTVRMETIRNVLEDLVTLDAPMVVKPTSLMVSSTSLMKCASLVTMILSSKMSLVISDTSMMRMEKYSFKTWRLMNLRH
jgi:hypothetical protein